MSTLLQQLVYGVILGGTVGLIALGYTMVYGIVQLINFAHGEIFMVGAFGALATFTWAIPEGVKGTWYITLPLMVIAGAVVSMVLALIIERLAYKPLRNAPRLAP